MKRILATVLSYDNYFPILKQVWRRAKELNVPEGYEVDYRLVIDSTNTIPEATQKYIDDNNIKVEIVPIDYEGMFNYVYKDTGKYVGNYGYFTSEEVWRVFLCREYIRNLVIKENFDYLLQIDGDVLPPKDGLLKLINEDKDIIGGWAYNKKGNNGVLLSPDRLEYGETYEIILLGTYFLLEKNYVSINVPYELFKDRTNLVDDQKRCFDLREKGYKMYLNPDVYCEHLDEKTGLPFESSIIKTIKTKEQKTKEILEDLKNRKQTNRYAIHKNNGIEIKNSVESVLKLTYEGKHKLKTYDLEPRLNHFDKVYGPKIECTNGGVEVELELDTKPDTNVFEFKLDYNNLTFYNQGIYTEEERKKELITCEGIKPENIEGSYVADYVVKKEKEHKGNMAFIIYRPKIKDSNNNEIFGELKVDKNKLTITVPQEFLDNATYPVIIDPTFGYEDIGGSYVSIDALIGTVFSGVVGTCIKLSAYLYGDATYNTIAGIYDASENLVATSNVVSVSTTPGWYDFIFSTPPSLTEQNYRLCVVGETDAYSYVYCAYTTGTTNQTSKMWSAYSETLPATFTKDAQFNTKLSIYATLSNYSKGDYVSLPGDDTDLETYYTTQNLTDVETKNDTRVDQTGAGQFIIHQFKNYVGVNTSCNLECELQTTLDPSTSTVYLQIYNRDTTTWDNVDTYTTSTVSTDFTLSGNVADLTNYKDGNNVISCRVYQEAV